MSKTPENLQAYLDGQTPWSPQLEQAFAMCCYLLSDEDLQDLITKLVEERTPGFVANQPLQPRAGSEQSGQANLADIFFSIDM